MALALPAWAVNRLGNKTRIRNFQYVGTEKTRLVKYLLYLYCVAGGFGNDFYSPGMTSIFDAR